MKALTAGLIVLSVVALALTGCAGVDHAQDTDADADVVSTYRPVRYQPDDRFMVMCLDLGNGLRGCQVR